MNAVAAPAAVANKIPGELPEDKFTRQSISAITQVNDHLFRFRTTRDRAFRFKPGQFARLGLFRDDTHGQHHGPRFVWRAYSVASADYDEFLEFYSIVVPEGDFTTALAKLKVGDSLLIEKQAYGFLTLDRFEGGRDLWLLASGTGVAPFISILYDLHAWAQYERLILVHCVRHADELAYQDTLEAFHTHAYFGEQLARHPGKLVVVPIVTREQVPGMLGERIPALLKNGALEAQAGVRLDPEHSRIMICGNPQMVDDVRNHLKGAGYAVSRRAQPAHMAVENYW
ncbi:MAG TPA: ferredoxin--NADP reductase [Burkholderiaceae bacterium]|nr:ferredoxin--NADP reductase [Burkholderiaceae bacterium]